MKKTYTILTLALAFIIGSAFTGGEPTESLELGKTAPKADLKMMNLDGKGVTLETLKEENGLLVVFSCNTCPFVVGREGKSEGWETRYNTVYRYAKRAKMGMVLVNSNEAKRDREDSMAEMRTHAKEMNYGMPYVIDEDHVLADAFGAKTTPHVFLFDGDMKLVYKGAIDDNVDNADAVENNYVIDAIEALSKGNEIETNSTKPIGCSIKRVKS